MYLEVVERRLSPVSCPVRVILGGILASLSTCAPVGPDYSSPEVPTPDFWNTQVRDGLHAATPDIATWWRRFDDPVLNQLITAARTQNHDLAVAAERVEEARARVAAVRGSLKPFVGGGGDAMRKRESESVEPGVQNRNPSFLYQTGTSAGWELDFVGGLRRAVEAVQAKKAATEELYRDALVVVFAELASTYVDYRALQERIEVAEANIGNQEETLRLAEERLATELSPEIDVAQAEANLKSTQARVPQLRAQLAATGNRLGVLCGKYPGVLGLGTREIPAPGRVASIGIPADLIRSRRDIRAAERRLAAQTARVGVARAELYPKFTLAGAFALEAPELEDVLTADSRVYGFGPSFRWRIFEGGRLRESIKIEESRTRQAFANYRRVILEAVAEVETALSAIANERDRLTLLEEAAAAARKAASLVRDNYLNELVDFQNVLDSERNLLRVEDEVVVSRAQIARAHIGLYRALGGGGQMGSSKGRERE